MIRCFVSFSSSSATPQRVLGQAWVFVGQPDHFLYCPDLGTVDTADQGSPSTILLISCLGTQSGLFQDSLRGQPIGLPAAGPNVWLAKFQGLDPPLSCPILVGFPVLHPPTISAWLRPASPTSHCVVPSSPAQSWLAQFCLALPGPARPHLA